MERFRRLIATDIPFARDDAHRLLPAMIACLVGFAALLLAVSLCLTASLSSQSHDVIGMLQVEAPRARGSEPGYLNSITDELKKTTGVEEVTIITQSQMETLLKPWLGDDFAIADLSLPILIDVKTAVKDNATTVDMAALTKALAKIDPTIHVEDRAPWVGHMIKAMTLLQGLVLLVAALLLLCVIGMIVLVARTNLRLHFKTVSLLHMFGATDDYILRQFQWNNAWLAARGAFGGVVFAAAIFITAVIISVRWHSPVIPEISISTPHVALFVLLPLFTAGIALIATRLTVKKMLEHMH